MLLLRTLIYLPVVAAALFVATAENSAGESANQIVFSHTLHVYEQEIDCSVCHAGVKTSRSAADQNLPTMDDCGTCHDIADSVGCGLCHSNPDEPGPIPAPIRSFRFNHDEHLRQSITCASCHGAVSLDTSIVFPAIPSKSLCMKCHDGDRASWACEICHGKTMALIDIHPREWRRQHGAEASINGDWCSVCHQSESICVDCHEGDNLSGMTHDLNYRYTHGLDVTAKDIDCSQCHDDRAFCNECHYRELRLPWRHSMAGWILEHGDEATMDVENCASCHDASDPTCARSECHVDTDGILGTNPVIHDDGAARFGTHGPWHSEDGYFCFQCHTNTRSAGAGFCGYCHGDD